MAKKIQTPESTVDAITAAPATDWGAEFRRRKQHNSPEAVKARAEARKAAEVITDENALDAASDEADELPDEYQGEDDPRIWLRRNRSESEPDMAAMETAAVDMVREARAATEIMTHDDLLETMHVNQMIGIANYSRALNNLSKVTMLKALQRIKDSKGYKNMAIPGQDGTIIRPKNFAELCTALGMSRSHVDEDLRNLAVFGGTLLEEQGRLGISYPELRALRAGIQGLPEDGQREVKDIIEAAAKSGDKMELLAALGEMGVYNTTLTQERDEARAQMEAQKKVQSKTAKRANELEIRLEQALNPSSEDERQKNLADARAALREQLDGECNALVGLVSTLCNHVSNVRKADTERAPDVPAVLDATTWEHVNNRVSIMCQILRGMLLDARLDVDFGTEFLESFTGMRGEPDDFMPETDESQQ